MNYKKQKALMFLMTGTIPLFVFAALDLMKFPMFGLYGFPLLAAVLMVWIGHIATSRNNWVKAIQGDCVLVLETNSTGVGKAYEAKVITNFFGGVDLLINTGGNNAEALAYDRSMAHRIGSPLKAFIQFFKGKESANKDKDEKPKITFTLDNESYEKAAWHYDYITVFFYDSQTGMLLNKPMMNEQEKAMMAEYVTLNEWRETKNLCRQMEALTNHMFNLLGQKFGGLLSNPVFQIFGAVVVVIILILVILMFFPQAAEILFPAAEKAASTAPAMKPIIGG